MNPSASRARWISLLVVTVLAAPASAGAATVSMTVQDDTGGGGGNGSYYPSRHYALTYAAAPGEVNDVTGSATPAAITVQDAGAVIAVGEGCQAVDAHTATCQTPPRAPGRDQGPDVVPGYVENSRTIEVDVGDGDDRFQASSGKDANFIVRGGAGDDRLSGSGDRDGIDLLGGDGADVLTGGAGRDGIQGGAGADVLAGGAGSGTLYGEQGADAITGAPGADTIEGGPDSDDLDGGAGRDSLSYRNHAAAVTVDLQRRTAGPSGEADEIKGFEDAYGGEGDDVLAGTPGANRLEGEGGTDELEGRAGDDVLWGERVTAGPGDDDLSGVRAVPDCGTGIDRMTTDHELPSPSVVLPANCERVDISGDSGDYVFMATTPRRSAGGLRFRLYLRTAVKPAHTVRVTIRSAGSHRRLGAGRVRIGGRGTRHVLVRLTAAGRRALRARRRVRVTYDGPKSGATSFGIRF